MFSPEGLCIRYIELLEIPGKRSEFVEVAVRSDQQVLIAAINRCEIAHEIPDVGAHSEFINFPNINRNSHRELTPSIIAVW